MATYSQSGTTEVPGDTNAKAVPAVFLSGFTPPAHGRDGVAFTLHALGAGFAAGAVLNYDGVDKATTVNSATDVSASITEVAGNTARAVPVFVKAGNGYSTPAAFSVT
jgi:hypothetical protein